MQGEGNSRLGQKHSSEEKRSRETQQTKLERGKADTPEKDGQGKTMNMLAVGFESGLYCDSLDTETTQTTCRLKFFLK